MLGRAHALGGFVAWEAVVPLVTHDPLTMAVGAAFAVWGSYGPDMDQVKSTWSNSYPLGGRVGSLISKAFGGHRMGTHSLVSIPLSGAVMFAVLALASLIQPYDGYRAVAWTVAWMVGWTSHILEDMLTVHGVGLLYPFSTNRFRIGNLHVSPSKKKLNFGEAMVGFLLIITGGFLFLNLVGGPLEQAIGHTAVHSSQSAGGGN